MQGARPNPNTGQHSTHHPRHSTGPQGKQQGGRQHAEGGHHHTTRPSFIMPPTIHYAAPPSTMAPPTTTVRGEHAEDTPPHEHHRHTPTTHTPQHLVRNSARHDSSTDEYCTGMSGARTHATAPDRTTAAHTTAPPHPEKDGHHPLIHSHSLMFTQQMINVDQ